MSKFNVGDRVKVVAYGPADNFPEFKERMLSKMLGRVGVVVRLIEPVSAQEIAIANALAMAFGMPAIGHDFNGDVQMYEIVYDEPITDTMPNGETFSSEGDCYLETELAFAEAA